MSRSILAGFISGIFLANVWIGQAAVATHTKQLEESAGIVAENKMDTVAIEVLHVPHTMNEPSLHNEVAILLLNLSLENEQEKNPRR